MQKTAFPTNLLSLASKCYQLFLMPHFDHNHQATTLLDSMITTLNASAQGYNNQYLHCSLNAFKLSEQRIRNFEVPSRLPNGCSHWQAPHQRRYRQAEFAL